MNLAGHFGVHDEPKPTFNMPGIPKYSAGAKKPSHSRLVRRSPCLSDAGLCRSTVRRITRKSNAATGQWNQILCIPVKALIRIKKPETVRAALMGRGRVANQSDTRRIHVDGSCLSPIR